MVKWTAAGEGGPDFIIITVKPADGTDTVSTAMSSRRDNTVIDLREGQKAYILTLAWFDSRTNKRGLKSTPVAFQTLAQPAPKSVVPCGNGNIFAENLAVAPAGAAKGGKRDYALGIIGNYPSWVMQVR
jgi:hypothetical protein